MKTFGVYRDRIAITVRTGDEIETFEFKTKRQADKKILRLMEAGYKLDRTHETLKGGVS